MIYMTKRIYLFLFPLIATSCSIVQYNDIIPVSRQLFFGVDKVKVDQDYINSVSYSFLRFNIGRQESYILTLRRIDSNGNYHWESVNQGKIMTNKYGKILTTYNLDFNITIFNDEFALENKTLTYNAMFHNPNAFVTQNANIEISESNTDIRYSVTEVINNVEIKAKWKNIYQLDKNLFPVYTKQKIHPNIPNIEMDFYFKF